MDEKYINVVNVRSKFAFFVISVIYSFNLLKLHKYNEQRYSTNF